MKIPEEKKQRIYQAALEEFVEHGFQNASTNRITQRAGISKGLLFHYFQNKKNLFLFVFDECVRQLTDLVTQKVTRLPDDLFERLLLFGRLKVEMYLEHPMEYRFIMNTWTKLPAGLEDDIIERQKKSQLNGVSLLLEGIDTTRFRSEIDPKKAISFILLSLEALGNQFVSRIANEPDVGLSQLDQLYEEMKEAIEYLKYGVYDPKFRGDDS